MFPRFETLSSAKLVQYFDIRKFILLFSIPFFLLILHI